MFALVSAFQSENWPKKIADEYGRRDLLLFGAREDNLADSPHVVGIK